MDEEVFIFISKPFTKQQEKEFSEFLKTQKAKSKLKAGRKGLREI